MKKFITVIKFIAILMLLVYAFVCFHSEQEFNAALSAMAAFIMLLDHKLSVVNAQLKRLNDMYEDEE